MHNIKIIRFPSLAQNIKVVVFLTLLSTNILAQAFPLEVALRQVVSEIIRQEYLFKNLESFNSFMKDHSFEELIISAEQSNQRSQEILFACITLWKVDPYIHWI